MSEKSKRPWFRFHLSTAVLFVLVGGGIVGANVTNRLPQLTKTDEEGFNLEELKVYSLYQHGVEEQYGWPLIARNVIDRYRSGSPIRPLIAPLTISQWNHSALLLDLLIAAGLLVCVTLTNEFIIRRREARKNER